MAHIEVAHQKFASHKALPPRSCNPRWVASDHARFLSPRNVYTITPIMAKHITQMN